MLPKRDIDAWVHRLEHIQRVQPGTLSQYRDVAYGFFTWCATNHPQLKDWGQIDGPIIEGFISRPRKRAAAPSAATMQRDRVIVGVLWKHLVHQGATTGDPFYDLPAIKVRNRQPKAIRDDLWSQLWSTQSIPMEDRVWLGLGFFIGLRRIEIISVAPSQFDTQRQLIFGLVRKGGGDDTVEYGEMARVIGDRLPHLLPDCDGWLDDVERLVGRRRGERVLFTDDTPTTQATRQRCSITDPLVPSPHAVNRQLARMLKLAGMPERAFSPHALRHSCATNLLRAGVPLDVVADCLGHHDPKVTMRYAKSAGRLAELRSGFAH